MVSVTTFKQLTIMVKKNTSKKFKELANKYQELRNEMIDELIKILPVNVVIEFSKPLYITRDYMTDASRISSMYDKVICPIVAMVVTPHKELLVLEGELSNGKKEDYIREYYSEKMQELVSHNDIEISDIETWFGVREIIDIPFSAFYNIYEEYCTLNRKKIILE